MSNGPLHHELTDVKRLIRVALGQEEAELTLHGAEYLNVFTERWEKGDVAIACGRIAGIGTYRGKRELELSGARVVPGLIDGHIHLESSLLTPVNTARVMLEHGTTSIICDPHEIANVIGLDGIRYILEATEDIGVDVFVMLPSCVPATSVDESFEALNADKLQTLLTHPRVLGLAEMMNYMGVLDMDEGVLRKLEMARVRGMPIDGHAPGLSGKQLSAYAAAGVNSDHECVTYSEALEKLRAGQWILIREGTAARNLSALLPLLQNPYARRCVFASDDKHPAELLRYGHIDGMAHVAIQNGTPSELVYAAASWNAARAYGLRDYGAIAPGYWADLAVLDSDGRVLTTIKKGRVLYDGGPVTLASPMINHELAERALHSFHMSPVSPEQLRCDCSLGVIGLVSGQILTENAGYASGVNIDRDILKIALFERHKNTGHVGLGYLSGYGLKLGAVATSVAHDSHNLIAVGTNDIDIACAAERLRVLGGGIALAMDGQITGELPLPIAGLMTDRSAELASDALEHLKALAASMGVAEGVDPFMTLSFMSLPVIPKLRILTRGVYDVCARQYITP